MGEMKKLSKMIIPIPKDISDLVKNMTEVKNDKLDKSESKDTNNVDSKE